MQKLGCWRLVFSFLAVGCATSVDEPTMPAGSSQAAGTAGTSTGAGGQPQGGALQTAGEGAGKAGASGSLGGPHGGGGVSGAGAVAPSWGGAAGAAGSSGAGGAGGAGGTGGAGGAGGAGSTAAGANGADCSHRLFCDDFENGTVGAAPLAPWKARVNNGQAKYDESKAVSGKRSMKLSQSAGSNGRAMLALEGAPAFPLKRNVIFGRFMFFTDRAPTPGIHSTFLWGEGKYMGSDTKYTYGFHDKLLAVYFRSTSPSTECWQHKLGSQLPTGKWQCIAYELNGETNEARLALGTADIPELHVVGSTRTTADCVNKSVDPKWYAPEPFTALVLGWENYGQDVARDTWIDDVVIDDEPVPCPP